MRTQTTARRGCPLRCCREVKYGFRTLIWGVYTLGRGVCGQQLLLSFLCREIWITYSRSYEGFGYSIKFSFNTCFWIHRPGEISMAWAKQEGCSESADAKLAGRTLRIFHTPNRFTDCPAPALFGDGGGGISRTTGCHSSLNTSKFGCLPLLSGLFIFGQTISINLCDPKDLQNRPLLEVSYTEIPVMCTIFSVYWRSFEKFHSINSKQAMNRSPPTFVPKGVVRP